LCCSSFGIPLGFGAQGCQEKREAFIRTDQDRLTLPIRLHSGGALQLLLVAVQRNSY
jgi:hypothetical protein